MKLKELRSRLDKWSSIHGADDLDVLVKVEDAILLPVIPNPDKDDNYYSIRDVCISLMETKGERPNSKT